MGEPFTLKDMEATGNVARSLEQHVERDVTYINGKIFNKIRGRGKLDFTDEQWQRYCTSFIKDQVARDHFNRLIIEATEKDIDLNNDITFIKKFAKHFRIKHEEKKDGYAQIIQLSGMGNLEKPKKKAEDIVKQINIKGNQI